MAKKLPVLLSMGVTPAKPTVDTMRQKLGGRISTERGAGEFVHLTGEGGFSFDGVVLCVRGEDVDVWTGEGVVRRATRKAVSPLQGAIREDLRSVGADATVFAGLTEGQSIRFRGSSANEPGRIVEKCRFGAIIERPDGALVAVSFRRIWPVTSN